MPDSVASYMAHKANDEAKRAWIEEEKRRPHAYRTVTPYMYWAMEEYGYGRMADGTFRINEDSGVGAGEECGEEAYADSNVGTGGECSEEAYADSAVGTGEECGEAEECVWYDERDGTE